MNKFSKLFLAFAASTMMLSSCSSEEPVAGSAKSDGNLYATITLSLPAGGRSQTVEPGENPAQSNNGFEIGNESENNVGSVLVVVATKDADTGAFTCIANSLADAHTSGSSTQAKPVYNIQFETSDLYGYQNSEVFIFAYCNPTQELVTAANNNFAATDGDFINLIGDATKSSISTPKGFFMSNALLSTTTLPTQDDMDNVYNTPEHPFNLGVIKVERAAARFDFKETTVEGQTTANLYPIYDQAAGDVDDESGDVKPAEHKLVAYVQLDGMQLLNSANNYYYLPRVSNDGTDANMILCGQETPNNYVVSPGWTYKTANTLSKTWILENYQNTGLADNASTAIDFTTFAYEPLNTSLGLDNTAEWNNDGAYGRYNIWKYTTENTIPAYTRGNVANYQRKGVTTGIVFKGHLVAADDDSDLSKAINAGTGTLYALNGVLYGNLAMLKAEVLANPVSQVAEAFKSAWSLDEINEDALTNLPDLTSTKGGFTLYKASNGQFPIYYAYYNRHNDNGNNTQMWPMEFSVVRNNVYKIAVSNILEFGHPGKPGDDPDPEDPDDPDESSKTYFRVQVEVLPWVVRVNNVIL